MSQKNKNLFAGNDILINPKTNQTCSKHLIHFLGGWQKYLKDFLPFYGPTINSYKRFNSSRKANLGLNLWGGLYILIKFFIKTKKI